MTPTARRRRVLLATGLVAVLALVGASGLISGTERPPVPSQSTSGGAPSLSVRAFGAVGDGRSDDRPAFQAAMDRAHQERKTVWVPAGVYLLASATQPGDRILRTYPDQRIAGAGREVVRLRVAPYFGTYVTVLGAESDRTDISNWELSGLTIDQDVLAGNETPVGSILDHPQMAVRLGSYRPGSRVTIRSSGLVGAAGLNGFYLFAQDVEVTGCVFDQIGGRPGSPVHDHSTVYTASVVSGGTQTITGNSFTAVERAGAARSAIDTHGGRQVISANRIVNYLHGINLTGMAQIATGPVLVEDNQLLDVAVGVELWVRRRSAETSREELAQVTVRGNVITTVAAEDIREDQPQEHGAVLVNPYNDSPVWGLAVENNSVADANPLRPDPDLVVIQCESRDPTSVRDLTVIGNRVPGPIDRLLSPGCRGAVSRLADNRTIRK